MEIAFGIAFLSLFSISALAGLALRQRLPDEHFSKENMEAVRLVTSLLVTFAALILSLQLSNARSSFDTANSDRSTYAARLTNLDQCLRDLGSSLSPARLQLHQYTAAVIASTWPTETKPSVEGMPDTTHMALRGEDPALARLFDEVGLAIASYNPSEGRDAVVSRRCQTSFDMAEQARWAVIEDTHARSGIFFILIIAFWLSLVFLSFGLQIPLKRMTVVVLAIGVVSISSVMFVIVDLDLPYRGIFSISSSSMRDALADMNGASSSHR